MGFNTRILDESIAAETMAPVLTALSDEENHFTVPLIHLLAGEPAATAALDLVYGPSLRTYMCRGLERLRDAFPEVDHRSTILIGPTLEGVGWYPKVDGNLRLLDTPVWVAGDACGLFRGIVAAMISGHYAAAAALTEL